MRGVKHLECRDLLSTVALIARIFRRLWCFDMKNVAMRSIVISHMRSAIHVYQICRNVEAGEGVLKH
jgi:hypothetical protein